MADQKITALNELAEADVASTDVLPIADVSASETKKVTVKSLVEQGVDLIDDASIPAAKLASISPSSLGSSSGAKEFIAGPTGAGGAYTSRVIAATDLPAATASALGGAAAGTGLTSTSGTFSVDPATTSARGAISVPSASGLNVDGSGVISHQSSVTGQTKNGFTVNDSGHITAVGSIAAGDLPKATSSAVGGVFIGSGLSVTASGQLNHTDSITAGTTSGITFNSEGHITATTALAASDLPAGTTSAKGGVSVPSGALSVSGAGALTHDNSGVTAGTYPKVTVDARGHVTAGTTLSASDIPDISAAKLTSGTIGTSLIANDAVTGGKLANGSSVRFAGAPDTNGVVDFGTADFNGQFLYDAYNENLYLYDGNAFKSIDIVSGEIVFAGTYDASTNLVASVTAKGTAIGLTVGQALIAPAASNLNHYLTVSVSGTGSGNAPAEALAPPDFLLSTGSSWQVLDLSTALAATAANNVSFAPTGNVAATDVQAAIEELDSEKLAANNPNMTGTATFAGNVVLGTAASLTFEGSSADDYETTFAITNPTADRTITFPNVTGTIITTGDSGTVTNGMLAGSIALTKLANLTSGQLIVGNSSNVPTAVALSGDATISNTGALTIANDAVTAAKLADTSVTAGSYTAADITVDAQGRITAAASGTIGTSEIADDAITADKLSDTSVTAGSYTAADITVDAQGRITAAASGTIGTSEIANDAVTADKLADTSVTAGSYTAADITVDAQGRITSAASGTIGTSEISNDAVTADKLADTSVTAGSYTLSSITVDAQGRITAASSGTAADTDKITEGNTEAEVVDTGSDGHFKVTTENTERIRVGPAGQIGIAGANYGTSGQVLTSGGASGAVSWADAASGGPSFTATASGSLANGAKVIINSDGTVSAVSGSSATKNVGSTVNASTGDCPAMDAVFDPTNNKVIVFYEDQDSSGLFVSTGTVSGTSITFGTQQTVASSGHTEPSIDIVGTGGKVVMAYTDGTTGLRAKIATVSSTGNSVVQGTEKSITTYECRKVSVSRSNTSNAFLIAFKKQVTGDNKGQCVACTFSGTTITAGTPADIESHSIDFVDTVFDPDNTKVVVVYKNSGDDDDGKFAVCTTSGTTATVNTTGYFKVSDTITKFIKINYDTYNNRHMILFCSGVNNSEGMYIVGTLSGTTFTFGSAFFFAASSDRPEAGSLAFDTNARKWIIKYQETAASDKPRFKVGTYTSATAVSWADETDVDSGTCNANAVVFDSNANKIVSMHNDNNNTQLEVNVITVPFSRTNLTTSNYVGISDAAYADGATATIQTTGAVDDAQSGLTPAETYYIQQDGTLATSADTPSVVAGIAVASTKLIVKG